MASVRDAFSPDTPARNPRPHARERVPATVVTVACHNDPRTLKSQWQELECLSGLPFMSYAWAEAWYQNAALTIDDEPAAINLAPIAKGCAHGLVLSMADTEAGRFGPGRQLLRRVIAECCARGLTMFDLGAGDDPSKPRWAEETVARRDVMVALSARGHAVVWGPRAFLKAKSAIKNLPAPVAHLFALPPLSRLLN